MAPHAHQCSHHAHHHDAGTAGMDDSRRLIFALLIIAGFAVVEIVGALLSGSLALLADAGHMVTDGTAIGLALVARHFAGRSPTAAFPFGQHRAQVLAAFVNGLALFALIAFLLHESFQRFSNPQSIDVPIMLSVAVLGLLANFAAFAVLHRGNSNDVNMRGAILHVIGDILGSVAAIVSAIVILTTGWLAADPLVTLLVCALIARSAWRLVRETSVVLLEGAPEGLDREDIRRHIEAIRHVVNVHDIKVWMLTPEHRQVTMHVQVDDPLFADETLRAVKTTLKAEFSIEQSTIQMETCTVMTRPSEQDTLRFDCPDMPTKRATQTHESERPEVSRLH
ncbi:cation diffusion facilitator family transporter [Parvularcula marina]|uniref:cation diffusion facilitator family transporter n=1 Tax=Parvularcula marina TaxID=2292771 RepID=UPI00351401DF